LGFLSILQRFTDAGKFSKSPAKSCPFGRAIEKTFEWPQLIDNFNLNFLEVGENAEKLAVLRVKKQLSMRQLSKVVGLTGFEPAPPWSQVPDFIGRSHGHF
jgi:hypothetical protein